MNARDGMQRLRDERRARGICTMCGLVKPEPGLKNCRECLDRAKQYCSKWRSNNAEYVRKRVMKSNARNKELRAERKEKKICVICGKNKPHPRRVTCDVCLEKRRLTDMK